MFEDMSGVTIRETRHLVLPLQTVLDAVVYFDRRHQGTLLGGDPMEAEFVGKSARGEGLQVAVRNDHTIEWRHVGIDDLSRAIIFYCRSRRIPLPLAAAKRLTITDRGAALAIENTVNLTKSAAVEKDLSGRPLRYARGYEPTAILPNSRSEVCV